ncbi:tail fiber domain-containing protein, partial [Glutamicibacter protophormiae]
ITGQTYIENGVIGRAQIANLAVGTAQIADAAITDAKIGSLSATKITTGTLNAGNVNIINLNANNISTGELTGINIHSSTFYGNSSDGNMQLNSTDLRFVTPNNSFRLNYGGIQNINNDYGTRNISFYSEGIQIASGSTNNGVNKNSGIRMVGSASYIDLLTNMGTGAYTARFIANTDNTAGIDNSKGNLYLKSAGIIQLISSGSVSLSGTGVTLNGAPLYGVSNVVLTDGTAGWSITSMNIRGITSKPYLNVSSGNSAWGVDMWSSDMRLKKNIRKTPDDALDIISKLMVRSYDWRDYDRHTDYGLIAQNVERYLPQAVLDVEQPESYSLKQISNEGIVPVLIKAIQELNEKIRRLEIKTREMAA